MVLYLMMVLSWIWGLNQQYMVFLFLVEVYMPSWVIESYREKWFFTVFIE